MSSEGSLSDTSSSSVKATSVEISNNSSDYRNNGDGNTEYDKKNSNSIDTFLDAVSSSNKDKEIKNSGWGSKDIDSSISRGEEKQSEVKSKED